MKNISVSTSGGDFITTEALIHKTFQMMNVTPVYPTIVDVEYLETHEMDGAMGWCYDTGDNEIQILIDKTIPHEELQTTIVHEAIHATQIVRGIPLCDVEAYHFENKL